MCLTAHRCDVGLAGLGVEPVHLCSRGKRSRLNISPTAIHSVKLGRNWLDSSVPSLCSAQRAETRACTSLDSQSASPLSLEKVCGYLITRAFRNLHWLGDHST